MRDYAYIVPFVEDEEKYFLKTIYPSREATKKYLDKNEKEPVESFEKGEWKPLAKKKTYVEASKDSMAKSKRINIRLTSKDYHDIQVKAIEESLPYQTLISSIIHKYNKGELKSI